MACRVGITTDPARRKQEWESKYSTLRNWRIVSEHGSKSEAQEVENRIEDACGCDAHHGGDGPENAYWYVYVFEHDGY